MIDHLVHIGGMDVSDEVIKINAQQSIENDSDPAKITITLANRHQKYSMAFPPQETAFDITIYNYTYKGEPHEFLIATGHVTDVSANHEEAVVKGECDLGHLADALPKDYDLFKNMTLKEILETVLKDHPGEPIKVYWMARNPVRDPITYNSDWTFQDVLEDLRLQAGAVYYFSEKNVLQFRDPADWKDSFDLDPYVTNPDQTASIMRFCNVVHVVGNQALVDTGREGKEIPGSLPLIGEARDEESIADVGELVAPLYPGYNLHTQKEVDDKAAELLRFYKMHKNALTKVQVAGMAPFLHSKVSWTPFEPISETELAKAQEAYNRRYGSRNVVISDTYAGEGEVPVQRTLTDKLYGIVIEKEVEYSIDGFDTTLTISPGILDMETAIGDEDIGPYTINFDPDEKWE